MKFTYSSGSKPLPGYTIKRGVGIGGFGEVYYAISDAGKEVALKLVRRNLEVELRGVRHCINLKHHNLLRLYDIRQDEQEDSWIVMEYVNGESLEAVITRHPDGMTEAMVHRWFLPLASGVAYLHDHGIVHRDLKPGNIFQDDGEVKIGDYGLSKFISCSRRSGQTESVGTVHYMAPEIGNGRYGKEIDIYALGIILYEMLTGRVPFEGESVGEVLMKHLTGEPDLSGVDSPYREIIARALVKDPEVRTSTVAEMIGALPVPSGLPASVAEIYQSSEMANTPAIVLDESSIVDNTGLLDQHHIEVVEPVDNPQKTAQPAYTAHHGSNATATETQREEPIWRAVRGGFSNLGNYWNSGEMNTFAKIILVVIGIVLLISFSAFLVPLGMVLGTVYIIYWIVREAFFSESQKNNVVQNENLAQPPPLHPANHQTPTDPIAYGASAIPPVKNPLDAELIDPPHHSAEAHRTHFQSHRQKRRQARYQRAMRRLEIKPVRQKFTELLGSMLSSALVIAISTILIALCMESIYGMNRSQFPSTSPPENFYAWITLTCVAGCWSLLIANKIWEGARGERVLRHCILIVIGLGVGLFAYWTADIFIAKQAFFSQHLNSEWDLAMMNQTNSAFVTRTASRAFPTMNSYLIYFAAMIGIQRWWKQANPLRSSRFRVWKTAASLFFALLCSLVIPFPQPTGALIAVVISIAIQLASPWENLKEHDPVQSESLV